MDIKTIQAYNQMAYHYDNETKDFWDKFPQTFVDKFVELVDGRVLDVGSGPGRDGLILKRRGLDIICLDASEVMVKICQDKGLESVKADFNNMPFEDEVFNGIWAYTSLLHVPKSDIFTSLKELGRVLKLGGVLGLGLIDGKGEQYRKSIGVTMPRLFVYYTKSEIEKLLENSGFEILYFEQFKPHIKHNYLNFIARKVKA